MRATPKGKRWQVGSALIPDHLNRATRRTVANGLSALSASRRGMNVLTAGMTLVSNNSRPASQPRERLGLAGLRLAAASGLRLAAHVGTHGRMDGGLRRQLRGQDDL